MELKKKALSMDIILMVCDMAQTLLWFDKDKNMKQNKLDFHWNGGD